MAKGDDGWEVEAEFRARIRRTGRDLAGKKRGFGAVGALSDMINQSEAAFAEGVAEVADAAVKEAEPSGLKKGNTLRGASLAGALSKANPRLKPKLLAAVGALSLAGAGAAAAQISAPQFVDQTVRAVLAAFSEEDREEKFSSKLNCAVASRIALKSEKPVYLTAPGCPDELNFVTSQMADADRPLRIQTVAGLEGEYSADSPKAIAGINLVGKLKIITSLGSTFGTGAYLSAYEAVAKDLEPYDAWYEKLSVAFEAAVYAAHQKSDEPLDELVSLMPACTGRGAPVSGSYGGDMCVELWCRNVKKVHWRWRISACLPLARKSRFW